MYIRKCGSLWESGRFGGRTGPGAGWGSGWLPSKLKKVGTKRSYRRVEKKPRREAAAFFHKKETLLLEGAGTPNVPQEKCTYPVQPT